MGSEFSAVWSGFSKLTSVLNETASGANLAAREAVAVGMAIVEREVKSNFVGAHGRGEPHVGGDKPNIVTGQLRDSLYPEPVKSVGPGEWSSSIGPRKVYGRRVELGYSGGGKGRGHGSTRSFPYFGPGVETAMPKVEEAHKQIWAKFFRA